MQIEDISALVQADITDAQVDVKIEGNHVSLRVVSAAFDGLNAVKRQQKVYACLQQAIADGTIHAVHMQTFTPDEWQAQG